MTSKYHIKKYLQSFQSAQQLKKKVKSNVGIAACIFTLQLHSWILVKNTCSFWVFSVSVKMCRVWTCSVAETIAEIKKYKCFICNKKCVMQPFINTWLKWRTKQLSSAATSHSFPILPPSGQTQHIWPLSKTWGSKAQSIPSCNSAYFLNLWKKYFTLWSRKKATYALNYTQQTSHNVL